MSPKLPEALRTLNDVLIDKPDGSSLKFGEALQPLQSSCIVVFLTHFGDLSSWEYAQQLAYYLPKLKDNSVNLLAVGIGSSTAAAKFSQQTKLPLEFLYSDPAGKCYQALGFEPGFGTGLNINPYLKLLPMLVGVSSPGTIPEVLRGYLGDKKASPAWIAKALRLVDDNRFDALGKGYQRPFELATLRLQNMMDILPQWDSLIPVNKNLITQQGGTFVIRDGKVVWSYRDSGILKYADIDQVLEAARLCEQ